MADKVVSLQEAGGLVRDGEMVALQGMVTQTAPMALVRELIRQDRRGLTLICLVGGMAVDWLAAAGAVERFIGAGVTMERFGLCRRFRAAVEAGRIRVEELSETALLARLGAGARNLPFLPTRGLLGTDLIRMNPESLRVIESPFDGEKVVACRRLVPDVALIHAHRADRMGNVGYEPTAIWPDLGIMPKAAQRVIVTAEEIVPTESLRVHPDRTLLPSFVVDAVVEVPHGAHPTSLFPRYGYDAKLHQEWADAARDPEAAEMFLMRYVREPEGQEGYLEAVGGEETLRRTESWETG